MPWVNKDEWARVLGNRISGFNKSGRSGDHVTPNPYHSYGGTSTSTYDVRSLIPIYVDLPNTGMMKSPDPEAFSFAQGAVNKAWSDFVDKAHSGSASLGEAIGESREGLEMVANRFSQMARGYKHLRHGQFRAFLRTFGIGAKRKHRNLIRNLPSQASGLWLEYSFGWKPLVGDVYDAVRTFDRPLPGGRVRGKGYENVTRRVGSFPNEQIYEAFCAVYQGADVYVDNLFAFTLSAMGLANPVSVAWNLLPFSFLIDWVADVGSYINSYTDLLGLRIVRPYCSVRVRERGFIRNQFWKDEIKLNTFNFVRRPQLVGPLPNVHFLANLGHSVNRAANAASLLVSVLSAPPRRDPGRLI